MRLTRAVDGYDADPSVVYLTAGINTARRVTTIPAGTAVVGEYTVGDHSMVVSCDTEGGKVWAQIWPPTDLERF